MWIMALNFETLFSWTPSINKWVFSQFSMWEQVKEKKNNGTIDIYLKGWWDREGASTSHAVKQRERWESVTSSPWQNQNLHLDEKNPKSQFCELKQMDVPCWYRLPVWSSVVIRMGWVIWFSLKYCLMQLSKRIMIPHEVHHPWRF